MKFKKYIFIVIYIEIKILQIKALDDVNGYTLFFFQIPKGMCFFFFLNAGMTIAMRSHRLWMYIHNIVVLSQCIYNSLCMMPAINFYALNTKKQLLDLNRPILTIQL